MAAFPEKARVVIIGLGGIVGASIAHHLIERGWDDIVGIDKSGIPTDIGSTAHASDFCYTTSHDYLSVWTTQYSIDFYEKMGHYARIGGLEVARTGDDNWMEEIKRKGNDASAKEQDTYGILQIVIEMLARGYHFLPVDIYKSDWRVYNIEDGKIRLPFSAIAGVGENAAKQLAQAKDDGMGEFISCDDLMARSGVGKSVVDSLREAGALGDLPESNQISLF